MTTTTPPLERAREGRILGGVCAGLARRYDLSATWLRLAFVAAALAGGIGVLVYLAGWLIVPGEGERGAAGRGVVLLAQACAAAVGLATLAAVGAAATLFGFGWVVVAVGAALLAAVLIGWTSVGAAWALLPHAALLTPAVALAATGLRLHPQAGAQSFVPLSAADVDRAAYRSGLGPLFIDLRHTRLPGTGTISMRVDAGVRRTLIALPHDRCVHVRVRYDVATAGARLADALGATGTGIRVFDSEAAMGAGALGGPATGHGPTLRLDFRSAGGSLYVRDYPDAIDPQNEVDWPGYEVFAEPRPDTTGIPKRAAQRLIASWRQRRARQIESRRRLEMLAPGPCATSPKAR
jgi:phage shock protein PspC (stress-responsive transcriptional regulator)